MKERAGQEPLVTSCDGAVHEQNLEAAERGARGRLWVLGDGDGQDRRVDRDGRAGVVAQGSWGRLGGALAGSHLVIVAPLR